MPRTPTAGFTWAPTTWMPASRPELLKAALPDGGKVMVFVGSIGAKNAKDRFQGIKDAIQGTKIEIIDVRTDGTDKVKAKANVQDTLVKYPDVAGLVGLWNYNGPAILNAVKEANKNGKVKIVCFDEEEDTLAGVKSGDIVGTVVQQPFEFGRQSIEVMAKTLRGDTTLIPASKQIYIPTKAITKENVDAFAAQPAKSTRSEVRGRPWRSWNCVRSANAFPAWWLARHGLRGGPRRSRGPDWGRTARASPP